MNPRDLVELVRALSRSKYFDPSLFARLTDALRKAFGEKALRGPQVLDVFRVDSQISTPTMLVSSTMAVNCCSLCWSSYLTLTGNALKQASNRSLCRHLLASANLTLECALRRGRTMSLKDVAILCERNNHQDFSVPLQMISVTYVRMLIQGEKL